MNQRFKLLTLIGVFSAFVIAGTTLLVSSQTQNNNPQNRQQDEQPDIKKIRQNQDPIADFNPNETNDPREKNFREKISNKFGLDKKIIRPEKVRNFELSENSPEILVSSGSSKFMPAFPLSKSDYVVIGKVLNSSAFLTNDRSNIYSLFSFGIDEIITERHKIC